MKQYILIVLLCLMNLTGCADDQPKVTPVNEPALREELLKRTKADQAVRDALVDWLRTNNSLGKAKLSGEKQEEYTKLVVAVTQADTENTKWFKEIIETHSWPTYTMVGKDGAQS